MQKIKNIRHVGVVVEDLAYSESFYERCFGFSIVRKMHETGSFIDHILAQEKIDVVTVKMISPCGHCGLELLSFTTPRFTSTPRTLFSQGLTHIALTVTNLGQLIVVLNKERVTFLSTPRVSDDGRAKVVFCRGPNQEFLELVEEL